MDALLNPLLSYLLLYKYVTLFVVEYSSAVILPLPVNAMLLAVGAFSSQGYFNFSIALVIAVAGNMLGDLTGYGIARKYGEPVIRKLKFDKVLFFQNLKQELRMDAAVTVFATRFAGSLSPVTNLLAGLVEVPFTTFLVFDFLGNLIEPLAALTLGYLVGDYWSDFPNLLGIITSIVAMGVILFTLARIYRRMMKKYSS